METEYKKAVGKGAGEVMRDVAEFLSTPYVIHPEKQIDLCSLLPDLNMTEQVAFALFSEALTQGWELDSAERFVTNALAPVGGGSSVAASMAAAFREPNGDAFAAYRQKYGNRFVMPSGSYWSTCLALGIDAGQVSEIMRYLRLFTVVLMEFAYMGENNPQTTYTWVYYESFRKILDDLTAEPAPAPQSLKVRALGGSAGKREGDGYPLSLGVDIENPNPDRMARNVSVDITLKDKSGNVVTVIRDRVQSIDPATVFHYGVTRKVCGAATASISATAKAADYLKLSTPVMKHARLNDFRLTTLDNGLCMSGTLLSKYDRPIRTLILHYQFLSADNKILGGGNEWIFDGMSPNVPLKVSSHIPVSVQNAAKAVYSVDFDAMELVRE